MMQRHMRALKAQKFNGIDIEEGEDFYAATEQEVKILLALGRAIEMFDPPKPTAEQPKRKRTLTRRDMRASGRGTDYETK